MWQELSSACVTCLDRSRVVGEVVNEGRKVSVSAALCTLCFRRSEWTQVTTFSSIFFCVEASHFKSNCCPRHCVVL